MTWAAILPLLVVQAALLAVSAVFSAGETALFSLTHADRLRLRRVNPRAAAAVQHLLSRPRRLLVLILLLNVAANAAFVVVSSLTASHFEGRAAAVGFSVACVLAMVLLAEMIPKSLATAHRVRFGGLIAPWLRSAGGVAGPFIVVFERAVLRPLARLLHPAGAGEARAVTADEIAALLESGAGRGVIDEDEQQLLSDVVALGTARVRDVMTPRVDLRWLPSTATVEQLAEVVRASGHTKIPLCRATVEGGVVGLVNATRVLAARAGASAPATRANLLQWAEPALFVPDRARLDQLLDLFRARRTHVAICVDELGAVTGLVEVEDAVRQLVRPVDAPGSPDAERVTMVAPGHWRVPGRLGIRRWAEFFGTERSAPSDRRVSTVAGLVLARLGRVPRVGDEVRLGTIRLGVESMSGRMIETIGVRIEEDGQA